MKSNKFSYFSLLFKKKNKKGVINWAVLQGPVVQSIVSLTSSLRGQLVKCFRTIYHIY